MKILNLKIAYDVDFSEAVRDDIINNYAKENEGHPIEFLQVPVNLYGDEEDREIYRQLLDEQVDYVNLKEE